MLKYLDGYKTYIVAVAGIILGVLTICGIVTGEQIKEWNTVIGESMILVSALVATVRNAIANK